MPHHVATRHIRRAIISLSLLTVIGGCGHGGNTSAFDRRDPNGRTYYIDGAGNWGFGVHEVVAGLRRAGYQGNIINYRWSLTLNPALDHTLGRGGARASGQSLAAEITRYRKQHPDTAVHLIALSAGTGVAVWACEALPASQPVDNVILLGSSLSSDYALDDAMKNIRGGLWVYHSWKDAILQGPVRWLGTIDGELGGESAGLVGIRRPQQHRDRVHNVEWSERYARYGWNGGHVDSIAQPFVQHVLAQHILTTSTEQVAGATPAEPQPRRSDHILSQGR